VEPSLPHLGPFFVSVVVFGSCRFFRAVRAGPVGASPAFHLDQPFPFPRCQTFSDGLEVTLR